MTEVQKSCGNANGGKIQVLMPRFFSRGLPFNGKFSASEWSFDQIFEMFVVLQYFTVNVISAQRKIFRNLRRAKEIT